MVNTSTSQVEDINSTFAFEEEFKMILQQHEKDRIMIEKHENIGMVLQDRSNEKNMDKNNSSSLRRRKNGAVTRPNLIDVVGQPKHKNSVLHDCLLDEIRSEQKMEENNRNEDMSKHYSMKNSTQAPDCSLDKDPKTENLEESIDYTEKLGTLINNMLLSDAEDICETKITDFECERNEIKTSSSRKVKSEEKVNVQMETRKVIVERKEDYFDISQCQYSPRHGNSLTEKRSPQHYRDVKRSRSLPVTTETKSRLPTLLASLRNKNNCNANPSSDGEGSAQSMMSFDSNVSTHSKRSRSGSILSRLSRSSSSPMSDKRSRSGSLTRNRTGCPQYFIPGENRGRLYMPTIDLFETSSLCIKGITFRIRRKMPRTHRAVSMIGCMGFIVPAPSTYFER